VFGEERRRTNTIPHAFGERPVLKLMHAALIRASESWRGVKVTEFETRQLQALGRIRSALTQNASALWCGSQRKVVPPQFTKMENQVNLYQPLALFVPNSAGDSQALLKLTLQAVSQTFPLLSHLLGVVGRTKLSPVRIEQLFTDAEGKAAADVLKLLFDKFGSDKSTGHNYHHLYGEILKNKDDISHVLEIGLGTNNLDVVSNMGTRGMPRSVTQSVSRVFA
jgi:hypothetical protein